MLKFVIDEDMPRSTANVLRSKGYEALDVRDCGLRGKNDLELNNQIIKAFDNLTEADFSGSLIIVEPGKIRIRKK